MTFFQIYFFEYYFINIFCLQKNYLILKNNFLAIEYLVITIINLSPNIYGRHF